MTASNEVPHFDYASMFEDSGYDTSTTHADDNLALGGAGQWAAEQFSNLHTEPLPPVANIFYEQDETDDEEHEDFLRQLSRRRWPLGICTMPRLNSKNTLPKLHPRPSLKSFYSGSSGKLSSGSLRSPDRFLSSVDCQDSSVQKFRISKDPEKLSPSEKLVRHDSASLDAFSPRRHFTTPTPPAVAMSRRNSISARPGGMIPRSFWEIVANPFRA